MRLKRAQSGTYVHQFSDLAYMKFKPKKLISQQKPLAPVSPPLLQRLKSFIWRKPATQYQQRSALSRSSSNISITSLSQRDIKGTSPTTMIIFLQKITPEHYLIGNQNQIDLVCVSGVVGSFVDTQTLWELNIDKPIKRLALETRKGYIAIETATQIVIYKYDHKRIKEKPEFFSSLPTKTQGMYIRFVKDSVLAVFYNNTIDVYCIEQNKIKKKMSKQFPNTQGMQLFQVPHAIEGCLNVFFIRKSKTCQTFQLWYIQVTFVGDVATLADIIKIYDIKDGLQKKIKLENYSREIFLMNSGYEIVAVKKGYIIDSAYLNIQQQSTFLYYIGNNRLLHLSPLKAQIYKFSINFNMNPPRIQITSLDSIQIKKPLNYQYIGALQMIDRNFAVFYQILPNCNKRTKGEITYCFAITRHVTIQDKVREIFMFQKDVKDVGLELIQEKVDMARKIGLNRVEIYLELWNRTQKTTVQQYQFLLDTLDYDTIKRQIQKKLKKSSMLFRQVYKIQQSCFNMIRFNLFSSNCKQQAVRQYLTCHFLLRKLQLYRDITVQQKACLPLQRSSSSLSPQQQILKINIQSYNRYMKADIKSLLLQLIQEYSCDNKEVLIHIRIFLKQFRFVFRIIYRELLEDIVKTIKGGLMKLLQNLQELLPYQHILNNQDDKTLYQGVWVDITRTQWEKNLHIEGITTIDNRQIIAETQKSLWFRRNFLTQHDMTCRSNEQIMRIHKSNNSDQIFYFFISKVFEYISASEGLQSIIRFVQLNYELMPAHLSQKIFLYRRIFQYLNSDCLSNPKLKDFYSLLQMKDYQLFKEFFQYQKIKKGCLLKDIKRIYQEVGGKDQTFVLQKEYNQKEDEQYQYVRGKMPPKGIKWFNEGILSYFSSDLSQVSDLKYILNRINSEKREFHAQNQNLIFVLVQAVQLKLRIGSENDVPITQVLLYLQNIPITPGNPVIQQLKKIQQISKQVLRFQQIKLNMTINEITKNCQTVINALICNQIQKQGVMNVTSTEQMTKLSYDIIADIQLLKESIYTNQFSDLTFFVYLTKILEEKNMIALAAELLQDQYLIKYFSVDLKVVEDLILYMYKLKLSANPKYIDNEQYLSQLLQILPQQNQCRIYIACECQYARLLSQNSNMMQYPLTQKGQGITIVQFQDRVSQLSSQFLMSLDIQTAHQLINKMQTICYEEEDETGSYTTLNQVYEVVILKLIQDKEISGSIKLVKRLLALDNNPYAVIYPLIFVQLLAQELNAQCKRALLKTVSYMFHEPLELLKIVEDQMQKIFTSIQRDCCFRGLANRAQLEYVKNYNPKNPILQSMFLQLIRNQQMQSNYILTITQSGHHLLKTKQQFNTFEYSLLYIILTQNPYVLGKYVFTKRFQINFKVLRSFLSYVIKQEIFDKLKVLQFARRLFNTVLQASQSVVTLQTITQQYQTMPIDQTVQFEISGVAEPVLPTDDDLIKKSKILDNKLIKCIEAFDRKKQSVLNQLSKNFLKQSIQLKKKRLQKQLINPVDLSEKAPSQYPFGDSDDDYEDEQKFQDISKSMLKRKKDVQSFNPSLQRTNLMHRSSKNYALFMSVKQPHFDMKELSQSVRGHGKPARKVRVSNMYKNQTQQAESLRLSQGFLLDKSSNRQELRKFSHFVNGTTGQMNQDDGNQNFKDAVSKSAVSNYLHHLQQDGSLGSPTINLSPSVSNSDCSAVQQMVQRSSQVIPSKLKINQCQSDIMQDSKQVSIQRNQISIQQIQFEQQFTVTIKEINQNQFVSIIKMKDNIFQSVSQVGQNFSIDLRQLSLQEDKDNQGFTQYLIQLIKAIYQDQNVKIKTRLKIITQIQTIYPDIGICKKYLQIYTRFESYHSKYQLPINMPLLFPIEYIFSQSIQPKQLFLNILPYVVQLVDQSNIHKISKMIHLAFKASAFEQQLFYSYLCIVVEKFGYNQLGDNQLNMEMEKINALVEKLSVIIVIERAKDMIIKVNNLQRRNVVIGILAAFVTKKKTKDDADNFRKTLEAL